MKKIVLTGLVLFALAPSISYAQVINWTAKIKKIHVSSSEVKVFVSNLSESNPNGSTWACTSDLVTVGTFEDQVSTSLKYSAAMEAYKSNVSVRIGVKGSGTNCLLEYITLNTVVI